MLWPSVLAAVAIFTLAVLNPLLCIIHCTQAHDHDSVLAGDQRQFLCDLENTIGTVLSAPFSAVWSGPRAVYDVLPSIPLSLVLITVIVTLRIVAALDAPSYITVPGFPPPKRSLPA